MADEPAASPTLLHALRTLLQEPTSPQLKTWDDVLQATIDSPILRQMVTLVERGDLTREQALIQTVLYLSDTHNRMMKDLVDQVAMRPPAPILACDGCPKLEGFRHG